MRISTPSAATALSAVLVAALLGGWWWSGTHETPLPTIREANVEVQPKGAPPAPLPSRDLVTSSIPALEPEALRLPPTLAKMKTAAASPEVLLLKDAKLVDHRVEAPDAQGQVRRLEVYRTPAFKYPLVRVEEWFAPSAMGEAKFLRREISVADHVMVRFPADLDQAKVQSWAVSKGFTLRKKLRSAPVYLVGTSRSDVDAADEVMKAYQESFPATTKAPSYMERDFVVSASLTPNDPSFPTLWGMNNTGQSGGVVDADIDAPEAWDITTGSRATLVGIIDTGFDRTHPDLAANAWTNTREIPGNGIDDDHNGYVDDVQGWDFYSNDNDPMDDNKHGTHCAGTIGAVGGNGAGLAGVCWQVSIVGLKFLSSTGSGATSDAVEAVNYATQLGVAMTSNSWGGGGFSQSLKDAIDAAGRAGIPFIAAAGNDSSDTDVSASYPASYTSENIISVASTTRMDALSSFSNYGATSVDLGAPGSEIYSTVLSSGYATLSGTSMATPHVTGALALVKSIAPYLTVSELKQRLLATTDPLPALSGRSVSGGRLNVGRFVQQSAGPAPVVSSNIIAEGSGANNDGVLNPGEAFTIAIGVTNRGTETASDITATISLPAGTSYSITASTVTVGTLAAGASASPTSTFILRSADGLTTPHLETATITLSYGSPLKSTVFTLPIRINTTAHISGIVTEQGTNKPLASATISYDGPTSGVVTTNAAGAYEFTAVNGSYSIKASASGWLTSAAQTVTAPPDRSGVNFALRQPNLELRPASVSLNLNSGDTAKQTLTLANHGTIPLTWQLSLVNEVVTANRVFHLPSVPLTEAVPDRASTNPKGTNTTAVVPMSSGLETTLDTLTGVKIGFLAGSSIVSAISADAAQRGATVQALSLPLTASYLADVNVIVIDDNLTYLSSNDVSVLRAWAQAGGGLLTEGDDASSMANLNAIIVGSGLVGSARGYYDITITDIRSHPITKGITSVVEGAAGVTFATSGTAAPLLVEDSGEVHAAVSSLGSGRIVVVGNEITASSNFGTGQARQCANQMIDYLALAGSPQWVHPSPTSGSIAVGSTAKVDLSFDAADLSGGTYLAHGIFTNNDPQAPEVTLPITMTVVGTPAIKLGSSALDFGHLVAGTDGERIFTVSNPGTDTLEISKFTLRGKGAASFVVNPHSAVNIAAGRSQNVQVLFVGSGIGDYSAELVISCNDPSDAEKVISLRASRVPPPRMIVSPSNAKLTVRQGDKASVSFAISNAGKGTLDWTALIGGNLPPGAKLSSTTGSLAPGKQKQVTLNVDATSWSADQMVGLRFYSQDPTASAILRMVEVHVVPAPVLQAEPSELRFGDTIAFESSLRSLQLKNSGQKPLVVKGAFSSNRSYSIDAKWPLTIEPFGVKSVGVTFRPTKVGTQSGSLLFTSNAATVRTAVPVSGKALQGPLLSASVKSLTLTVVPGSDEKRTVTITNNGGTALVWSAMITQTGGAPAPPVVILPVSSGSTAIGGSTSLDLIFATSAVDAGNYSYALDLTTNDPQHRTLRVPIKLSVLSKGWLVASPPSISFADTAVGGISGQDLVFTNPGNLPVEINSIALDSEEFGFTSLSLPTIVNPGQELRLNLTFAPKTTGDHQTALTCVTNSKLTPLFNIPLQGQGHPPPIAALDVTRFTATIDPGSRVKGNFVLSNTGDYPLTWDSNLVNGPGFINFSPSSGTVPAHSSQPLLVTFAPTSSTVGGDYAARLNLTTDDPFNQVLAIDFSITVNAKPVMTLSTNSIVFQAASAGNPGQTTIMITNLGNKPLVISSVASSSTDFSLAGLTLPATIAPGITVTPSVLFEPKATGTRIGSLTFATNITTGPSPTLRCTGLGVEPPALSVTPSVLSEKIGIDQALTRNLTINNTGGFNLQWNASVSYLTTPNGAIDTSLPAVSQRLDQAAAGLTALIPGLYSFSEGVTSSSIVDGGSDMYDTGNYLSTSLGSNIPYSDGTISTHAALGIGGSYFTRKNTGLFAFVADLVGPTSFSITGNLGADGSGFVSSTTLSRTLGGVSYRGFVKRVYSAGDASVNHLIIVADRTGLSHSYSSDTDNDLHTLNGLSGSSRVYYLLFATQNGSLVSTATMGSVMDYFLAKVVAPGASNWLTLNASTGTVATNAFDTLTCTMKSAGLSGGTYTAQVSFTSNDPAHLTLNVPVSLTVQSAPNFFASPSSLTFANTFLSDRNTALLTISSTGNAPLVVSSLDSTDPSFAVTGVTFPLSIPQGQSQNVTVEFAPKRIGGIGGTLRVQTNANATPTGISLSGTCFAAPLATVSPGSLEVSGVPGTTVSGNVVLTNNEGSLLSWFASIPPGSIGSLGSTTFGALTAGSSVAIPVSFVVSPTIATGSYPSTLVITTNDPLHHTFNIPLTLLINPTASGTTASQEPDLGSLAVSSMVDAVNLLNLARAAFIDTSMALSPIIDLDGDGSLDVSVLQPITDSSTSTHRYVRRANFVPGIEGSADWIHWLSLAPGLDYTEDNVVTDTSGTETVSLSISPKKYVGWQFRLAPQPH